MKATWRTTADEPASAALRRLHREATLPKLKPTESPTATEVAAYFAARATIDNAIPALADIVAEVEIEHAFHNSDKDCTHRCLALATLREQMGAR